MLRSSLLLFIGALISSLGILIGWLVSADCPPNRLILSADLPEPLTAQVFIQGRLIWSGSKHHSETLNFPMQSGEGQFVVKISNGTEATRGYVENGDGYDHILFVSADDVGYDSIDRGLAEFLRRRTACRGQEFPREKTH
ncbi:MAG: hypothetical protein H7Z12_19530 [Rhodospirillaceae bacterium]|nr:hypothetical protein [Rhodospirillales bacterium]